MTDLPRAVNALARAARLLERTANGLTLADYRVLSAVAGGEARASRLARRLAVGKPSISATVDGLVRRGLLSRAAVPGDNRCLHLTLTAAGQALLAAAEHAMSERLAGVVARCGDPADVLAALAALGDAIDAELAEPVPVAR